MRLNHIFRRTPQYPQSQGVRPQCCTSVLAGFATHYAVTPGCCEESERWICDRIRESAESAVHPYFLMDSPAGRTLRCLVEVPYGIVDGTLDDRESIRFLTYFPVQRPAGGIWLFHLGLSAA